MLTPRMAFALFGSACLWIYILLVTCTPYVTCMNRIEGKSCGSELYVLVSSVLETGNNKRELIINALSIRALLV